MIPLIMQPRRRFVKLPPVQGCPLPRSSLAGAGNGKSNRSTLGWLAAARVRTGAP
jgi:hypothetical protein